MRMVDIIHKKRDGGILTTEEISFFIRGCVSGEIPDYQLSALLMAVYYQGMTAAETTALTMEMARSGDMVDLSPIPGIKVDKHSTGGVGDKTTLIIGPIAAASGVKIAKMSGRGLGHTGGTVDKLESIPGFKTDIGREEFLRIVRETGLSVIGQSGNLCPADKKLYALRDVTATVESIPLIASSVMSKKIAAGADRIVLDVKTGSGAFMKTAEGARRLAEEMVRIGERSGRKTVALITGMDSPLGQNIGNALELIEACDVLQGNGPEDLTALCIELAAHMIWLGGRAGSKDEAEHKAKETLQDGSAFSKLKEMVTAQGGDASYLEDTSKFFISPVRHEVRSIQEGFVQALNAEACGLAAVVLGAGRETKESAIDFGAGIRVLRNKGASVKAGDVLAELYAQSEEACKAAEEILLHAYQIGKEKPESKPLIVDAIGV